MNAEQRPINPKPGDPVFNELKWGPVTLDDEEFAEFKACAQTPQRPTPSIIEGAEQLRKLL